MSKPETITVPWAACFDDYYDTADTLDGAVALALERVSDIIDRRGGHEARHVATLIIAREVRFCTGDDDDECYCGNYHEHDYNWLSSTQERRHAVSVRWEDGQPVLIVEGLEVWRV